MILPTKKTFTARTIIVGALFVVLVLTACQGQQPAEPADDAPSGPAVDGAGNEAVIVDTGEQEAVTADLSLDPANIDSGDEDSILIAGLIYEGLVTPAGDPSLAIAWTVSEDGLDYIFELDPTISFQDGTPLNADAVIANFNRWFDPDDSARGSGAYANWEAAFLGFKGETNDDGTAKSTFDGIEKVDNTTVLLHLSRQDDDLLSNLGLIFFAIASPNDVNSGTGPYSVGSWNDELLVLTPNPDYRLDVAEGDLEFPLQ